MIREEDLIKLYRFKPKMIELKIINNVTFIKRYKPKKFSYISGDFRIDNGVWEEQKFYADETYNIPAYA